MEKIGTMGMASAVAALLLATACETANNGDGGSSAGADNTGTGDSALVRCEGINECKGQGLCASADGQNSCEGQNSCKGLGWINVTEEECDDKGGKILAADDNQVPAGGNAAGGNVNAGGDAAGGSAAGGEVALGGSAEIPAEPEMLKCQGINSCSGTSECAIPGESSCAGLNECAGKGWIYATQEECDDQGGTVLA